MNSLRLRPISWRCLLLALLVLLPAFRLVAQENYHNFTSKKAVPKLRFRAMTWNVENLYDTLHDAGFDDLEFLPTAERAWNSYRYWHKQGMIARTLLGAGGVQPVDVVALCEIENDSVLHHLCRRTRLARLGYAYLSAPSHDQRGIDVALLYQPETFLYLAHQQHAVPFDSLRERPTRDILHVSGRILTGDTLDIFVLHLPSRRGGATFSSPYRRRTTRLLRQLCDSLLHCRRAPHLLAMGDFNDEATDASIAIELAPTLTSLSHHARPYPLPDRPIRGTYFFQGQWSRIDQMLVNVALLRPQEKLYTRPTDCHIYAPEWLLETRGAYRDIPYRSYLGTYYHGGVSDHLPLLLDLWY